MARLTAACTVGGAGRVIASKNDRFAVGDAVTGALGVQEYVLSDGAGLIKVDTKVAPLPVYLGTLGMPGMTAYFGLFEVGQPKAGETVVVSAAAGAVGAVVGQLAKIKGCRAVGIAGGAEKCRYVVDKLGFDAAVDYKHEPGEPQTSGFVVIGVVRDIKYNSLREAVAPTTYSPAIGRGVNFALRTAGSPTALMTSVREAVRQTDPNLPIIDISTQDDTIDRLLAQERIIAQLASFIGLLSLLLACTGLFGLLSHEVGSRTREIGIRMALGARRADVLSLVLGTGLAVTTLGLACGAGAAFGVTRYLKSILFDVQPADPITFIAVGALLLCVALLACYLPARRAATVDPLNALRAE